MMALEWSVCCLGLAKHGEYDLTEKMKQQTKSLTPTGKEPAQVLKQIGKEAAQVMEIEEGGIKFVDQVEGKLKADCDGGGKTGKNSDCDGGGKTGKTSDCDGGGKTGKNSDYDGGGR